MFCPNCGAQIQDGAAFCAACGTNLSAGTGAPVQQYPAPRRVKTSLIVGICIAVVAVVVAIVLCVTLIGSGGAKGTLEKYLDDAYLAHMDQVRIVHGRGTGALKNMVHERLKKIKYVDSFRLGVFGEGDTGVTIVKFK